MRSPMMPATRTAQMRRTPHKTKQVDRKPSIPRPVHPGGAPRHARRNCQIASNAPVPQATSATVAPIRPNAGATSKRRLGHAPTKATNPKAWSVARKCSLSSPAAKPPPANSKMIAARLMPSNASGYFSWACIKSEPKTHIAKMLKTKTSVVAATKNAVFRPWWVRPSGVSDRVDMKSVLRKPDCLLLVIIPDQVARAQEVTAGYLPTATPRTASSTAGTAPSRSRSTKKATSPTPTWAADRQPQLLPLHLQGRRCH